MNQDANISPRSEGNPVERDDRTHIYCHQENSLNVNRELEFNDEYDCLHNPLIMLGVDYFAQSWIPISYLSVSSQFTPTTSWPVEEQARHTNRILPATLEWGRNAESYDAPCSTLRQEAEPYTRVPEHGKLVHYKCGFPECPFKTDHKATIKRHVERSDHRHVKYTCDWCNNSFSRKDTLRRHKKRKHEDLNRAE